MWRNKMIRSIVGAVFTMLAILALVVACAATARAQDVQPSSEGLHVTEIRAWCQPGVGVGGYAVFSNDGDTPVAQEAVTMFLTYHLPGEFEWQPTGDRKTLYVDAPVGGVITETFTMSSTPLLEANSYRVENSHDTTKSLSWKGCTPNAIVLSGFSAEEVSPEAGQAVLLLVLVVAVVKGIQALLRGAFPRVE